MVRGGGRRLYGYRRHSGLGECQRQVSGMPLSVVLFWFLGGSIQVTYDQGPFAAVDLQVQLPHSQGRTYGWNVTGDGWQSACHYGIDSTAGCLYSGFECIYLPFSIQHCTEASSSMALSIFSNIASWLACMEDCASSTGCIVTWMAFNISGSTFEVFILGGGGGGGHFGQNLISSVLWISGHPVAKWDS